MAILKFEPNVQIAIALRFTEGRPSEGRFGDQMMYSLSEPPDHVMYLNNDVAAKLNMIEPGKGETILACKRWTGKKSDKPQWDFWRPNDGEKPVKRTEAAPVSAATAPIAGVTQPPNGNNDNRNGSTNGSNGSNGNGAVGSAQFAPGHGPELPLRPASVRVPTKVPLNVAVVELVMVVQNAMKATGEQWSDTSRQDLVSTLLIQAGKEGWVGMWERGGK